MDSCLDIDSETAIVSAIRRGDVYFARAVARRIVEDNPDCDLFFDIIAGLNPDPDPETERAVLLFAREELDYYLNGSLIDA